MPIAFILLVIGVVFVAGGIKNWSIPDLLLGRVKDKGGSSGSFGSGFTGSSGGTTAGNQPANPSSIISIAKQYLGTPYKFGGNDPNIGIDCSRFVQLVFSSVGVTLPRTTFLQYKQGKVVSINDLQPGDVIFTRLTPEGPDHEGLYIGNNQVQESPQTGEVNKVIPLQSFLGDGLVGVRRYI
jgi:peptidoglycan DL-endopeptidase CwlO